MKNKTEIKIIKKYPNAYLTSCGDKEHKKGCYIKLKNGKVEHSEEMNVLFDYNKKFELIGVDLITK
jgi:hypothetical protein